MRRLGALLLLVVACGGPEAEVTLTVFAASSLTTAFQEIAEGFEEENPGIDVVLNVAGSQTLATQILQGAGADVFASADTVQMERTVSREQPIFDPRTFATNRLVIAVPAGNPARIGSVADLARDDITLVLGAEEVPVGRYTRRILERASVELTAASYESDVGLVLAKVALGEADAGIVYESDLLREEDVEGVAIPVGVNVIARYPIAAWERDEGRPGLAVDFVEYVTSDEGRQALEDAGFGT